MDRVAADAPTRRRREAEGRVLVLILGKQGPVIMGPRQRSNGLRQLRETLAPGHPIAH